MEETIDKKSSNTIAILLSMGLTATIVLIIAKMLQLYPFGNNALLYSDGEQYLGFLSYFRDIARTKSNLLYSWEYVLGDNMIPAMAYYALSPFNVLLFLFKSDLILGIHFIAYVKFIVASISFCVLLNRRYEESSPVIRALFSVCYALSGYMVFYTWNLSWMDAVIILPVVVLGLYKLLDGETALVYILSLGYIVISQYYLAFMICLATIIFYVAYQFIYQENFLAGVKQSFLRYAVSSLIGVGLGMPVLLTVVLALPQHRVVNILDDYKNRGVNLRFIDFVSGIFTGRSELQAENNPIIYVGGVVVLVLLVLFFTNGSIKARARLAVGGVILCFALSCFSSTVNLLWHGMSDNIWCNYRYSFIICFVLLLTAFHSLQRLPGADINYGPTAAIAVVITLWVQTELQGSFHGKGVILDTVVLIVSLFLVIYFKQRTELLSMLLSVIMILSALVNADMIIAEQSAETKTPDYYFGNLAEIQACKDLISDDGFYRMERSYNWHDNDPMIYGYNGMTAYASPIDFDFVVPAMDYGMVQFWWCGRFNKDLPVLMDAFLGFKYFLYQDDPMEKPYQYIGTASDVLVYKNQFAMPFIISGNSDADAKENVFESLNALWQSVTGVSDGRFYEDLAKNAVEQTTVGDLYSLTFTLDTPSLVYLYLPDGTGDAYYENSTGSDSINCSGDKRVYCMGEQPAGGEVSVYVTTSTPDRVAVYRENADLIESTWSNAVKSGLNVEEISSSHLNAIYSAESNKVAFASIPYDEGWHVYIDGKMVKTEALWGLYTKFDIPAGDHTIKLVYYPPGFIPGLVICGICFVLFIIIWVKEEKTVRKEEEASEENEAQST